MEAAVLFSQKGRPMDGLPSTQAALVEHTKRAAYQAGHAQAQMFIAVPKLPRPGCKRSKEARKCSGPHIPKRLMPVVNCSGVIERRAVGDGDNV